MDRRTLILAVAAAAIARPASSSTAFPRPIKVIVPAGPGGFTDIVARYVSQELSNRIGQSVIVENRGGAGGVIAAVGAAQSAADSYTLFMGNNNTHAMNVGLYRKLPYDPQKDFVPVGFIGSAPTVLVVHPESPFRSVTELIAGAKAKPGALTYGSGGIGASSHMAAELLRQRAGIDIIHVPFKGNAPATQALLGNQITFMFDTLPSVQPLAQGGRLRPLAGTALERIPAPGSHWSHRPTRPSRSSMRSIANSPRFCPNRRSRPDSTSSGHRPGCAARSNSGSSLPPRSRSGMA
jgi:tripartite-type tricarboxylate transporter receptor subunit TctC